MGTCILLDKWIELCYGCSRNKSATRQETMSRQAVRLISPWKFPTGPLGELCSTAPPRRFWHLAS